MTKSAELYQMGKNLILWKSFFKKVKYAEFRGSVEEWQQWFIETDEKGLLELSPPPAEVFRHARVGNRYISWSRVKVSLDVRFKRDSPRSIFWVDVKPVKEEIEKLIIYLSMLQINSKTTLSKWMSFGTNQGMSWPTWIFE